jgi:hypothetical protein
MLCILCVGFSIKLIATHRLAAWDNLLVRIDLVALDITYSTSSLQPALNTDDDILDSTISLKKQRIERTERSLAALKESRLLASASAHAPPAFSLITLPLIDVKTCTHPALRFSSLPRAHTYLRLFLLNSFPVVSCSGTPSFLSQILGRNHALLILMRHSA